MSSIFKKLSAGILAILVVALLSGLTQAQPSQFRFPSPSGSFLAGQYAFKELSTADAASALMEAAESQWDNPAVIERAFAALVADGRVRQAEPVARRMLELAPDSSLAKLVVATVALKERRYASVVSGLDGMGLSDFVDITALVVRAWARVGQTDIERAFVELDRSANDSLKNFLAFHKALMADLAGRPVAIDYARKAYENDPFMGRVVELYVQVLANNGHTQEALDVLSSFEAQGLSHPSVDYVRQQILAGRLPGKFANSIPEATAELFQGIGVAIGRDGSPEVALVFLQLGRYLHPKSDTLALSIAQFLEASERFEAANDVYSRIPKNSLYKVGAMTRVAQNIDSLGDRPEAIRRLRNIVATNPGSLVAITALGDLLRLDEQFEEAAEIYTKAIALVGGERPRDWRFFYLRGIAYERSGAWEAAESDFLKALELNPSQPQVLNYLGYSWAEMGINLQRALGMIEQAVRTNPGDGYIVDSLGWAIFKLNRFDEAVQILEEAVKLSPNDPEINDHLGDAYWRVGRKNEAYFQWNIALDMDERGVVTARVPRGEWT